MQLQRTEKRRAFLINVAYIAILVAIAFLAIKYLILWIMPFVIGFGVAFVLQRPIVWVSKKTRMNRRVSAVLLVFVTMAILVTALLVVGYQVYAELGSLLQKLPEMVESAIPSVTKGIEEAFSGLTSTLSPDAAEQLASMLEGAAGSLQSQLISLSGSMLSWLGHGVTQLPSFLISLLVTIIATFFLSMDYRKVVDFIRRQIPQRHQALVTTIKETFVSTILKVLRAYLIIMTITFVELSLLLTFWVQVDYAVILAGVIALVDVLPILGCGTVLIPWAVVAAIMGDWMLAIKIATSYGVITIIRNVIEPKIVGQQIGLHPLVTLFCMYFGLQVLGVLGMFLVPIAVILLKKVQDSGQIRIWK